MNDFTKEELEQIRAWATTDVDLSPSELEISLFDKIQSMIDNYCDHEEEVEVIMNAQGGFHMRCKICFKMWK